MFNILNIMYLIFHDGRRSPDGTIRSFIVALQGWILRSEQKTACYVPLFHIGMEHSWAQLHAAIQAHRINISFFSLFSYSNAPR